MSLEDIPGAADEREMLVGFLDHYRPNEIVRAVDSLDDRAKHPRLASLSLRWILLHMLEETARHAGHVDITPELVDGTTGE